MSFSAQAIQETPAPEVDPGSPVPSASLVPPVRLVPPLASEPDPDSDEALVARAQRGEEPAFERLVRKHQHHALSIALGLVRDEHDAKEIVQEAFLRVHRGLPNFQGTSAFFTWLYRIITNLAIDWMRKPQRRETEPLDVAMLEQAEEVPCLAPIDGDPFDVLGRKELVGRLDAVVDALPAYHRGVILMRELDGLSYEQMAERMGVSKGTIMSRLFHARHKMQRSLVAEFEEHVGYAPKVN